LPLYRLSKIIRIKEKLKSKSCTRKQGRSKHCPYGGAAATSPDATAAGARSSLLFALGRLAGLLLGVNIGIVLIFSLLVTFQLLRKRVRVS